MGGEPALLLEVTVIIYALNEAAWTSFLGMAVVIRMFSPVILLPTKIIYFPPVDIYAQRS